MAHHQILLAFHHPRSLHGEGHRKRTCGEEDGPGRVPLRYRYLHTCGGMHRGLSSLYYGSLFCVFVAERGSAVIEVSADGASSLLLCPVLHMESVSAKLAGVCCCLGELFVTVRLCAGVDLQGRPLLADGVDFLALFLLVSSTLPGNLPVFSDQIHPVDLQQEVCVPVVGRHPGLAAGPLLHGVHPSLDHLQTLHHQRLPQRGECSGIRAWLCFCVEVQPCRGIICVLQVDYQGA